MSAPRPNHWQQILEAQAKTVCPPETKARIWNRIAAELALDHRTPAPSLEPEPDNQAAP